MTRRQHILHLVLQVLAILGATGAGLMAVDVQIHPILALSPQLSVWWPAVLAGAAILSKFANALVSVFALLWPDVPPPQPVVLMYPETGTGPDSTGQARRTLFGGAPPPPLSPGS